MTCNYTCREKIMYRKKMTKCEKRGQVVTSN